MRETLTRSLSGIVYIALLTAAVFYSPFTFLFLFGIFLAISVMEFCSLVNLQSGLPLALSVVAFFLCTWFPVSDLSLILIVVAALIVSVKCLLFLFDPQRQFHDTTSKYVYITGYLTLPFILITKIPFNEIGYDPRIIVGIFILIWTNDTFAFVVGKSIGKHKLFEKISPKKTIEGFIGGVAFAIIASVLIALYFVDQPVYIWIITALIVSIFGTLGDLVQSKFKRVANVKDSGKIMPGHGGILDRLDSIIFAAPFVFLFYQIIYYVS